MTTEITFARQETSFKVRVRRQHLVNGEWKDEELNQHTTFELTSKTPVKQYVHGGQRLIVEEYKD